MPKNQEDRPALPPALHFGAVALCFLISGVAALIYQLAWMRYLSTVFGTSELAVVAVLVGYMGGLALGAWTAAKILQRIKRPILTYAVLEAIIAVSALLVPWLLRGIRDLHLMLNGNQPAPPADGGVLEAVSCLVLGCVVLLIPTGCMGATLPILIKGVVHRPEQIGRRVGQLYALNTAGAVVGTVTAAFYLIPAHGLFYTTLVAVGLNVVAAMLGWLIARTATVQTDQPTKSPIPAGAPQVKSAHDSRVLPWMILAVMLLSGFISFAYEILWTRLLSHLLGGSLYAFATMLAAFLLGIAAGGLLGARIATESRRSAIWLAAAELATGVLAAGGFYIVASQPFVSIGFDLSVFGRALLCGAILLSSTLCLGATIPLAIRSLTDDPACAARWTGRVYAWNTVGAILGAVVAGYFIIPWIGYANTFGTLVSANFLLGVSVLLFLRPAPKPMTVAAAVLTIVSVLVYNPSPPLRLLAQSPLTGQSRRAAQNDLVHHAVGRSASVTVLRQEGSFKLRTNGLPEAEVFARGAAGLSYTTIHWMPSLPRVLRPESRSLLVVGFGGGTLLEAVPGGFEAIDVIEIEEKVILANQWLADKRAVDPLQDTRLTVVINDARGALGLTAKRYDVILSQPSHPWTAGASHLYTQEFFKLARDHLTPKGLFVQWIGAHFVDEALFRSFARTMVDVFPHVHLYFFGGNFLFVGSAAALDAGYLAAADTSGSLRHLSEYPKLSVVEDVLAALQLDESGCRRLGASSPPITDDCNLMATHVLPGTKMAETLDNPTHLRKVLEDIHYLNQPTLLNLFDELDTRYLTELIRAGSPHIDFRRFEERFPATDRLVTRVLAHIEGQPLKAAELLRTTPRPLQADDRTGMTLRSLEAQLLFAQALREWSRGSRGTFPRELPTFLGGYQRLRAAFEALPPRRRAVVEARYWSVSRQPSRVRSRLPELASFDDHRDVWFESASHAQIDSLLDPTAKSAAEQSRDLGEAALLLDRLLALPLINRVPVAAKRLEVAHRMQDYDYLVALGWVLVKNISRTPSDSPAPSTRVFSRLLGRLLAPYSDRSRGGRLRFSNKTIAGFYDEVIRRFGPGVLPEELR